MMLQGDPAELLRETLEGYDIATDLDTIDRISENLRILQNERDLNVEIKQKELKELASELYKKREAIDEIVNSTHRSDILESLKKNETLELQLNKNLKNLTSDKQNLSAQLSGLIDNFNELEKKTQEDDFITEEDDKNSIVLKLLVYRKLGLKIDLKSSILIIFNKEKNLTDFLNFKDDKYSDYFISNYIWDRF